MPTAFETWLSSDYLKLLHCIEHDQAVLSTGQSIASVYSREQKAAYLLWVQLGSPEPEWARRTRELARPAAPLEIVGTLI